MSLDRYLALCIWCKTSLFTDTPPDSWYSCPICHGATLKLTISYAMETIENTPKTLTQAVRYFSDPDVCLAYLVPVRWPAGVVTCPTCGRGDPRFLASRRDVSSKFLNIDL